MNSLSKHTEEDLLIRLRIQKLINGILFLSLLGGLGLYFLYQPRKFNMSQIELKRFGPVDPAKAKKNLEIYRKRGAYASLSLYPNMKVHGILHDTTDFRNYIREKLESFTSSHSPMKNCIWQIGVYPMICKVVFDGSEKPRVGFYFIPTMLDTTAVPKETGIKDYLSVINHATDYIYYLKDSDRPKPSLKLLNDQEYIFDEGHLWP